jgi:hypothetical protein
VRRRGGGRWHGWRARWLVTALDTALDMVFITALIKARGEVAERRR